MSRDRNSMGKKWGRCQCLFIYFFCLLTHLNSLIHVSDHYRGEKPSRLLSQIQFKEATKSHTVTEKTKQNKTNNQTNKTNKWSKLHTHMTLVSWIQWNTEQNIPTEDSSVPLVTDKLIRSYTSRLQNYAWFSQEGRKGSKATIRWSSHSDGWTSECSTALNSN